MNAIAKQPELPIKRIIERCAEAGGVTPAQITSMQRHAALVRTRHIAMWIAAKVAGASLPQIGWAFGNRDHSTVINAIRQIDWLRDHNPEARLMIDRLAAELAPQSQVATEAEQMIAEVVEAVRRALQRAADRDPEALCRHIRQLVADGVLATDTPEVAP